MAESNVKKVEIRQADIAAEGKKPAWYFNARAGNGEIVATSELYTTKEDAKRGADSVFPDVPQEVQEADDGDQA